MVSKEGSQGGLRGNKEMVLVFREGLTHVQAIFITRSFMCVLLVPGKLGVDIRSQLGSDIFCCQSRTVFKPWFLALRCFQLTSLRHLFKIEMYMSRRDIV